MNAELPGVKLILNSGFLMHAGTSNLFHSQEIEVLNSLINSKEMTVSLSAPKQNYIKNSINRVKKMKEQL